MEYLTLQDIPHRHCEPLHSRKMNSSHPAERPLANMVAAVSQQQDSPSSLPASAPSPPRFLEPALRDPFRSDGKNAPMRARASETSAYASSQYLGRPPSTATGGLGDHALSPAPPRSYSLPNRRQSPSREPTMLSSFCLRSVTPDETRPPACSSTALTESQNQHMRSSPPIQPGEQSFPGKLPSFSEFLHTTRTTTPPRTPQRRNDSTESSPHVKPQFDDVTWSESKRRRVDTLGDIYEPPVVQARRMSSVIDPGLAGYSPHIPQQHAVQPVGSAMQHRASHSYAPPQHQSMPLNPHMRHHSPQAPQGHMPYLPPSLQQPIGQSPFQQPMVQQGAMYEPRHSYYQEPQAAVYSSYERPNESYFARAGFPAYDTSYSDIRFQQHVGLDHNAFNRKRRGNLPKEATNLLKDWFAANRTSPYPTEDQKMELCNRTGLSLNQVSNWFINARRRAPQKEQREREANGPEA